MSEIRFIDTTLRDGQQSLWALGMKTDTMLGAASQMDRIGFESMEFFVSIMIKNTCANIRKILGFGCARASNNSATHVYAITAVCTAPAPWKNCPRPPCSCSPSVLSLTESR